MRLGIIGGTGSAGLFPDAVVAPAAGGGKDAAGPWGIPSTPLQRIALAGHEVIVVARHGVPGAPAIPPHKVNYRANLWALSEAHVDHVLAINAVGGIARQATPGRLVLPDQLIDYTWGREHTYTGTNSFPLRHVDFTEPFSSPLRTLLLEAARSTGLGLMPVATYGVMQGPRLESAAEIDRLERDGCDLVGMTAMPEAGLARELDLSYAMCCVVVNQAAGRVPAGTTIHGQIALSLEEGMAGVRQLIDSLLSIAGKAR